MIKHGDIIIKDTSVLRGLMERNYHPLLIDIICEVADEFGIVMTEAWRQKRHSNDVHGTNPGRALDLRTWCYPEYKAYQIKRWINTKWEYDSDRSEMKVAIIHKVKEGSEHFHIQVSNKTRRKING